MWWSKVSCCSFENNSLFLFPRGSMDLTLPKSHISFHLCPWSQDNTLFPAFLCSGDLAPWIPRSYGSLPEIVFVLFPFLKDCLPIQQIGSPKFSLWNSSMQSFGYSSLKYYFCVFIIIPCISVLYAYHKSYELNN